MSITTAVAGSVETMSDIEGMAMLTGVFIFLIIMFLLLAWLAWAVMHQNRKQARHTRAVYRFYEGQFKGAGADVKKWWDR
ncbi:hypothetical protein [Pseudarthrobacter sp. ATCC 49987]|uniref:hypothetical protein n=1 Tax=Pseudarthrobacter sp. ATCC 49987 TaxID=2698204 RepID=UPI00136F9A69|nr:hypothetical protein [Pseudarthrobacter sp. ATCC 49987]